MHADNNTIIFMTEDWKPFNYKSSKKNVDGFTTAIVEKIANNLGVDISITIAPWSRSYKTALEHKQHAIFSIYRTQKREALFKWVGPVYKVSTVLWGLESSNLKINSLDDAKKYKILVQQDSAYQQALEEMGFKNYETNASKREAHIILKGGGDLVPWSAFSLEKLQKATVDANMPNEKWKAYAILYSKPVYIAFNIHTPDQVVKDWQAELDKLKKHSFYSDLETKFIKPILYQEGNL